MDLKEIQNLIKFVANSGVAEVKLEMDDVKITIRTTLEGNVTEATYVQQLPAQAGTCNKQLPQQIAPVAATTRSSASSTIIQNSLQLNHQLLVLSIENQLQINQFLLKLEAQLLKVMFFA